MVASLCCSRLKFQKLYLEGQLVLDKASDLLHQKVLDLTTFETEHDITDLQSFTPNTHHWSPVTPYEPVRFSMVQHLLLPCNILCSQ